MTNICKNILWSTAFSFSSWFIFVTFLFHDQHRNLFHRDRNIFTIVKLFLLTEFFLSPSCRVSFRGSVCVAVSWFCGSPIFRHFGVVLFFWGSPWVSWLSLFVVWPTWLQFLFVTYSCMEIVLIPTLLFLKHSKAWCPWKHFWLLTVFDSFCDLFWYTHLYGPAHCQPLLHTP